MKNRLYLVFTLFLAFTTTFHLRAQDIIISIAGNTTEGYRGDDSSALDCLVHWPEDVALDAAWNVYIADADNNVIRKISSSTGKITTVVGSGFEAGTGLGGYGGDGGPASAARLWYPSGVAFDTAGNMYIADQNNNRVRMVSKSTGMISTIAGTGVVGYSGDGAAANAALLYGPTRVTTDTFGNIYIADAGNNCIRQINSSGVINTIAGTGTAGYSGDGGPATMALLSAPRDMAVDDSGYVYIADYVNSRIRKIDLTGNITTIAGIGVPGFFGDSAAATAANIFEPTGITVDKSGNIFFSDFGNERIRKIDTAGIITTIAGNGAGGYSGDGRDAIDAEMKFPEGLAVNTLGGIYFADKANNRIRYISGTLAVSQVKNNIAGIKVYPNPNEGVFTVNISSGIDEPVSISVTDITGQRVGLLHAATNHPAALNLTVPPGVYFISAVTAHGIANEKVMVQ